MKRKRLSSLILLLLITFIAYSFTYILEDIPQANAASERLICRDVCMQLDKVEGTLLSIRINGWSEIGCGYIPLPVLIKKAKELLPMLGDGLQTLIVSGETQDYRQVKLTAADNGVEYCLMLYSSILSDNQNGEHKTYIIVDAVLDSGSFDKEESVYRNLEDLLSLFESLPSISITYIAAIPGKLEGSEMESAGRQVLEGLNGRIIEMSRDSEWISLTGYSSRIQGGLHSDSGIFNMNIALRYNSHEGRTFLWLGTPVISTSY